MINNINGIDAIYVRRSVSDRDNKSLSIESQKEDCIRYIGDSEYRIYCDNGFSGKDTEHRPQFQQMMADARNGEISRIIVKKYDRFSRNLRDYLNVTDELEKYGVSVYSLTEPFNTETKEGRLMRNNLLTFAEFERETIASRVADAYNTKARETGFYMGGVMIFGYAPQRISVNGKVGSVLVPNEQSDAVKLAYEMYCNPSTSLRDIISYFRNNDIQYLRTDKYGRNHNGRLNVSSLSVMLKNPVYVRADKDVYAYFISKGYDVLDEPEMYDGVHGVYLRKNGTGGYYAKVGSHEGIIEASVWLAVQDKKTHNVTFTSMGKAQNSWIVGLVKCKECGHAVNIDKHIKKSGKIFRYNVDYGWSTIESCVGRSYPINKAETLEEAIFEAMENRINELRIEKQKKTAPDTEAESLKSEILKIDDEINQLMEKMAYADSVVFEYIQGRINTLHSKKTEIERKLQTKARKKKSIDTKPLEEPLKNWNKMTIQQQHDIAATIIDCVYISHNSEEIEIKFSI